MARALADWGLGKQETCQLGENGCLPKCAHRSGVKDVPPRLALLVYYNRSNRYSFNALLGALGTRPHGWQVHVATSAEQLLLELPRLASTNDLTAVCISFCSTQLWDTGTLMSSLLLLENQRVFFIAGGPHPTGDSRGTLDMGFNLVVRGEGEETFLSVLEGLERGEVSPDIRGVAHRGADGAVTETARARRVDLDSFPSFAVPFGRFGPIEITRGCPYFCSFCQTPYLVGGRPRHRSVESVVRHIDWMRSRNLRDVRFVTPNSFSYGSRDGRTVDPAAVEQLLRASRQAVGEAGRIFFGSFPSEVRPEHVTTEMVELVRRYANNDNLIIGGQSGSQRVLDLCHRGHSVEDVYGAVRVTRRANLTPNVDIIFGLPGESQQDVGLTISFIRRLVTLGARVHAHIFMPLPQTRFSRACAGGLSAATRKLIAEELTPSGLIYGDWRTQEDMARRLAAYLGRGAPGNGHP